MGLDPTGIGTIATAAAKIISLFKADPNIKLQGDIQLEQTALVGQIQEVLAQIAADAAEQAAVNTTMQAETKAAWFSRDWRPFWGWISAIAFGFEVFCVGSIMLRDGLANIATAIPAITQLVTAMIPLWTVPLAILGIVAWHQGKADVASVGSNGSSGH